MTKYIIREVAQEQSDFSFYFDGDCFKGAGDEFKYNLFIRMDTRRGANFNEEEFDNIIQTAYEMQEHFDDLQIGYTGYYSTFKEIMLDYGISYNSTKCCKLKKVLNGFDESIESMIDFLNIYTDCNWNYVTCRGYCQGDICNVIYCPDVYKEESAIVAGEIWLGAGKEFCVIEIDESGKEIDSCYGFIVADSQAKTDEDYKRLVSEWYGVNEDETRLEMIDSWKTYTKYEYRIA